MHAAWISSGAVLLFATLSCAQLWGFHDGQLEADDLDAALVDASGSGPDASLPVDVTLPVPSTCEQRTADRSGIFVDAAASASNEVCSADAPCRSIQRALSVVSATRRIVYVGRGIYDESLQISAALLGEGLRIEGRWEHRADAWVPSCAPDAELQIMTTLEVGARDSTVDAGSRGALELAYLVLRARPPQGELVSSYGLVVHDARVVLVGARVIADRGRDGFSAGDANRPPRAEGSTECTQASVAAGQDGQSGAALGAGAYTIDGFVAALVPNRAAGAGSPGSCAQCSRSGDGGAPGVSGAGGGASVAAYLWDALLEVTEGSALQVLGGGTGGNGGPGGLGASGECSALASTGGTGGTGSPGPGGPTACIVHAGSRSGSLGANAEACILPAFGAAGGAGGDGVQAAAGVLAMID